MNRSIRKSAGASAAVQMLHRSAKRVGRTELDLRTRPRTRRRPATKLRNCAVRSGPLQTAITECCTNLTRASCQAIPTGRHTMSTQVPPAGRGKDTDLVGFSARGLRDAAGTA